VPWRAGVLLAGAQKLEDGVGHQPSITSFRINVP
jgi:hypothetical protein